MPSKPLCVAMPQAKKGATGNTPTSSPRGGAVKEGLAGLQAAIAKKKVKGELYNTRDRAVKIHSSEHTWCPKGSLDGPCQGIPGWAMVGLGGLRAVWYRCNDEPDESYGKGRMMV